MSDKRRKKQLAILNVLRAAQDPLSGGQIARMLMDRGQDISERTVRLYLREMDEEGLTLGLGKRGRQITEKGMRELDASQILQRVGFLSAKIDQITYRMSFDLAMRSGSVVVNVTVVEPKHVAVAIDKICNVFAKGYAMGHLAILLGAGERVGDMTVPAGMVGIGTVCSITLNGVLLKHGIPTNSRFGGLLELRKGEATRFVEIINYDGTSIDPLEVFIRSGMTDYHGAIASGDGRIGASFREIPAESRDLVVDLARKLDTIGLGGFMDIGYGGQSLLEIPVSEGRSGAIVIGGLNPVAILEESGVRVHSRALAGLVEFNRLEHFEQLKVRIKEFL